MRIPCHWWIIKGMNWICGPVDQHGINKTNLNIYFKVNGFFLGWTIWQIHYKKTHWHFNDLFLTNLDYEAWNIQTLKPSSASNSLFVLSFWADSQSNHSFIQGRNRKICWFSTTNNNNTVFIFSLRLIPNCLFQI